MYKLERNTRKDHNTFPIPPSFSSILLDQIYRSIDEGQSKNTETKFYRETTTTSKKHWTEKKTDRKDNNNKVRSKNVAVVKATDNRKFHHDHDPDVLFFSSTSISSDSSFGGFSSSDTESAWPKPVRTSASFRWENEKKQGKRVLNDGGFHNVQSLMHLPAQHKKGVTGVRDEEALIKSKSRALKIYNNLKKMKQPISPGGRLTSFLNSLFATGEAKKKKKNDESERRVNSGQGSSSTCCSASSFSRSCLSKVSSCDREKMSSGVKRTVRFDEEEKNMVVQKAAREFLREYCQSNQKKKHDLVLKHLASGINVNYTKENEYEDFDDEDDAASYASSDLFELDHLGVMGNSMYDEELPVFETTHFSTNHAIANGIRVK